MSNSTLRRRSFVRLLATTGSAAVLQSLGISGAAQQPAGEKPLPKNWVWFRPDPHKSTEEWQRLFEKLANANIQAVLPEVYDGNVALFEQSNPLIPSRANVLERMIPLAHAAGIEVHAWMWTVICRNPHVASKHGDWYSVNRKGEPANTKPAYVGYYKFLCPRQPEARQFIASHVTALASIAELDGVHLDYVRLPDVILAKGLWDKYGIVQDKEYPQYDYCYCGHCRAEFKRETGADPLTDLDDPPADQAWRQFRYDGVSQLVRAHLAPIARQQGKAITAAVFPNWEYVRQAWHTWGLDAYLPMLYHSFYDENISWIGEETSAAIARLESPAEVFPGLFVPSLTPAELSEAVATAKKAGGSGVALFDLNALTAKHWDRLAVALRQ